MGVDIGTIARLFGREKEKPMTSLDFQYDPKDASSAWPAGSYEATISKVEKSLSKANNDPMLVITYTVYGAPGGPTRGQKLSDLKDFITNPPKSSGRKGGLWKLRALCEAVGLGPAFTAGKLNPKQLEGKNLIVSLTETYDAKYGDQNKIDSYAPLDRAPLAPAAEADDEVPF